MELVSPPDVIEEVVRDLDIGLSSGYLEAITIRGNDWYKIYKDRIVVTQNSQTATYYIAHIAYRRERTRTIKTPVKRAPTQNATGRSAVQQAITASESGYGHAV